MVEVMTIISTCIGAFGTLLMAFVIWTGNRRSNKNTQESQLFQQMVSIAAARDEEVKKLREDISVLSGKVEMLTEAVNLANHKSLAQESQIIGLTHERDVLFEENGQLKSRLEKPRPSRVTPAK